MHGYTDEKVLIGKNAFELIAPTHLEKATKNMFKVLQDGIVKNVEYDAIKKDGSIISITMSATVLKDDNDTTVGFLAMTQDVSHAKQMEEQLRQSQKMQAIGQLAGGIAHDFNNQLAGIVGYADILRETLLDDNDLTQYAENILLAAKRASDLTSQLLAFARKGKYMSVSVDIHKIINEIVAMLQRTIDKRIVLKQHLNAQNPLAKGDPTLIQNMIMNIAINARDSMPSGGELIITTSIVSLDSSYCEKSPFDITHGEYVQISVTDNGIGMSKETQEKVFEPFFTTKEVGKGTGMGLASVYGTIKSHGGAVNIYSEINHGTTMTVYLPLLTGDTNTNNETEEQALTETKSIHILLVDDEETVLNVATAMLERSGHKVSICTNGKDAVEFFKNNRDHIDLIILDMVMPEMNGKDAFRKMKSIDPKVKVLLTSGYSINEEAQQILNEGILGFIQKPYRRKNLSQKVAEVMNT